MPGQTHAMTKSSAYPCKRVGHYYHYIVMDIVIVVIKIYQNFGIV